MFDDDENKYKGYGHILAIGRDNPSQFFFIPVITCFPCLFYSLIY